MRNELDKVQLLAAAVFSEVHRESRKKENAPDGQEKSNKWRQKVALNCMLVSVRAISHCTHKKIDSVARCPHC